MLGMDDATLDSQPTANDGDRQPVDSRVTVTVAEAAELLGLSVDAVRSRLHRGTLQGLKDGNTWRVILPEDVPAPGFKSDNLSGTRLPPTAEVTVTDGQRLSGDPVDNALVDHLRGEVEYLRDELSEARRQLETMARQAASERERADILQREALGRIAALTATIEDRQAQQSVTDGTPEPTESPESDESRATGIVAWLRRLWGG